MSQKNNSQKVVFITGANRGIGFETAKTLAEEGLRVIIGAREAKQGQAAVAKLRDLNLSADSIVFDVNNFKDHKAAASYIAEKYGHLDILINNAGVMLDAGDASGDRSNNTSSVSVEKLENTFQTNFFSVVALTQTLLPLIRKSKAGRIVNLSSILGSLGLHADPKSPIFNSKLFAYNSSKTALNAFTVHLAHELKDTGIKVNSAHPGWVKTDMGGPAATLEVSDGAKTSVQLALLTDDGPTGGYFHLGERLPW
jgi:NAD(P)-dependent dehydrogenase (short-subunit alcohol dehydrogenase family)